MWEVKILCFDQSTFEDQNITDLQYIKDYYTKHTCEKESDSVSVCVCVRERERESVCTCVYVCVRTYGIREWESN